MRRRGLAACLALGLALLAGAPSVSAQERSLLIESFDGTIAVQSDGSLQVHEAIRVRFTGSWNGIYRMIPVVYRAEELRGAANRTIRLDLDSVTDDEGTSLEVETSRERQYRRLKIWVPGAQDAVRTLHIRYRVRDALLFFDDEDGFEGGGAHDELYWNVTGDEWEMPIRRASARVELPDGATGLRATAFAGASGSQERAVSIQELDDGFYFEAERDLGYKQGMTVVVGWDPGVVDRPTAADNAWRFLMSNWLLFLPFLSFFVMFRRWRVHGKDPARRAIAPAYRPPEGMTPAEIGTLIDNRPDSRDITATLVDLAVRGHLRIEEVEDKKLMGLVSKTDYELTKLDPPSDSEPLKPYEETLIRGVWGSLGGGTVRLSDLENSFYKHLPTIKERIFSELVGAGYYDRRPDKVAGLYVGLGVAAIAMGFPLAIALGNASIIPIPVLILSVVLTAAPIIGFGIFMPARTVSGTRKLEDILGFEEFLDKVDSDRFKRMITGPEMFEAYLPFAMALGLEKKWARAFDGMLQEPPDWYVGHHHGMFRPHVFVNDLGSMTTATSQAFASAPRSSGSSGFSGGSSGGGFGGGGGGGF